MSNGSLFGAGAAVLTACIALGKAAGPQVVSALVWRRGRGQAFAYAFLCTLGLLVLDGSREWPWHRRRSLRVRAPGTRPKAPPPSKGAGGGMRRPYWTFPNMSDAFPPHHGIEASVAGLKVLSMPRRHCRSIPPIVLQVDANRRQSANRTPKGEYEKNPESDHEDVNTAASERQLWEITLFS